MVKKKPIDIVAAGRAVIASSLLDQGACVSKPYRNDAVDAHRSSAQVVSVLTERGGAEACEYVLPETAKAIVAAFNPGGWGDALDAIERVHKMCRDLIEVERIDLDRYGQAGAHESVTKARVARDFLKALGVKP